MTNTGFSTTMQGPIPFGVALPQPAIEPMVRVPRGEYSWLARALDLGARGA